ncbi:MAG: HDIG domain-containing protein [Bacteroidales bacterium]|nr:HDIG domain-containing protein [Bacteroidales bacterium]
MEKNNLPRGYKVYLPLIGIFILLVFLLPRNPKFTFDYRKGSPWMYETLISQFDFPVLKTEAQLQQERMQAWSSVVPYFRLDLEAVSNLDKRLSGKDFGRYSYVRSAVADALSGVYSKGVVSSVGLQDGILENPAGQIYVQQDRRAVKVPVSEVFTVEQASAYMLETLKSSFPKLNMDSLWTAANLSELIRPDLVYDQQTTDIVHEESVENISPTSGIVRAGQVIVNNGETVTAEIEQLLDSYRAEYNSSVGYDAPTVYQWLSNILIAFSLVLLLFLAIYYCNYTIFGQYNKYLYLLLVFTIAAVASCLVEMTNPSLFYMIPFTLIALYLLAFFKTRMVFAVYLISLLPMLVIAPEGMELFLMYLVAGGVGIMVFGFFNKGWLQFVTAFIVFVVMVLVWGAFRLADGPGGLNDYNTIVRMALGAFMSVAGYPLIYLFEKIFKLVSNSKLVDLSDTSNKLLRELADKAPGTFQHSLQVMNLADAAARAIDANVLLVRAGALYHDIGKIANPQCFTENETPGVHYHAELTPKESAQEIIRHVSDGLAMADRHGLPEIIRDFIKTHHGTTSTGYFYTKYLNDGGDPDDVAEFFYDGEKPVTKEQVILMLCDAVEAASRSLKDYSPEHISALVDRIVDGKANDGQLTNSVISLHELNVVKDVIKSYLQQMYHSRVSYPKRKGGRR